MEVILCLYIHCCGRVVEGYMQCCCSVFFPVLGLCGEGAVLLPTFFILTSGGGLAWEACCYLFSVSPAFCFSFLSSSFGFFSFLSLSLHISCAYHVHLGRIPSRYFTLRDYQPAECQTDAEEERMGCLHFLCRSFSSNFSFFLLGSGLPGLVSGLDRFS